MTTRTTLRILIYMISTPAIICNMFEYTDYQSEIRGRDERKRERERVIERERGRGNRDTEREIETHNER